MNELKDYYHKVTLRNGQNAIIRAIQAEDKSLLLDGFQRTSQQSVYNRFLGTKDHLTDSDLQYLTEIDYQRHMAIVICLEEKFQEMLVGVGRYFLTTDSSLAEIAFSVDDSHHNMGIGTLLFEHLVTIAQTMKIKKLRGEMLIENGKMLEIFQRSGFDLNMEVKGGVASVEFSIENVEFNKYSK